MDVTGPSCLTSSTSTGPTAASAIDEDDTTTTIGALALELVARSHHRDVTLQRLLLHWKHTMDAATARRRRQEVTATSYFNCKLQFTAFRAWQWEFYERHRRVDRILAADEMQYQLTLRRPWRQWRLLVHRRREQRSAIVLMSDVSNRRVIYCSTCACGDMQHRRQRSLCTSPQPGESNDIYCFWHRWLRAGRRRLSLLQTQQYVQHTQRRKLLALLVQWLFRNKARRLRLLQLQQRLHLQNLHQWLTTWQCVARRQRLQQWQHASTLLLQSTKRCSMSRVRCGYWRPWYHKTRVIKLLQDTSRRMMSHVLRTWVKWIAVRRYERATMRAADGHWKRRVIQQWFTAMKRCCMDREHLEIASCFYESTVQSRITRRCWSVWTLRKACRVRRRELEAAVPATRRALLTLLALRRLGDVAVADTPVAHSNAIRGDNSTSTRNPPPQLQLTNFSVPLLKPIPLGAHRVVPATSDHHTEVGRGPSLSPHTQRRSTSPPPHYPATTAPMSVPSLAQEQHIRQLLDRFNALQATSSQDALTRKALAARQVFLQEQLASNRRAAQNDRRGGLPNTTSDSDKQLQRQNNVEAWSKELVAVESELYHLRQTADIRALLRSQIIILQRDLRNMLHTTTQSSRTPRGEETTSSVLYLQHQQRVAPLLHTPPRSEASFRSLDHGRCGDY